MLEPSHFNQIFPHQNKHGKFGKSILFLEKDYVIKTCNIETLAPELDAYCQLKHKYIPKIYGWTYDVKSAYLSIAIEKGSPISSRQPEELRKIAKMLVQVCKYIHSKNRIHGDIKIDNIIRCQGVYKLIDWELSKIGFLHHEEIKYIGPSGTVTFKDFDFDPEVPYTSAVDIYSIGKTLSVLINGEVYTSSPALCDKDSELSNMIKDCMCPKSSRLSAVELEKKYSWLGEDDTSIQTTSCSSSSISYSISPSNFSHNDRSNQLIESPRTNNLDEKNSIINVKPINDFLEICKKISLDLKCVFIILYNIGRFWNAVNTKDISSYILANLTIGSSISQDVVFSIDDIDSKLYDTTSTLIYKILDLTGGHIDIETTWNNTSLNTLKNNFNDIVKKTILVLNSRMSTTEYINLFKSSFSSKNISVCLGPYKYYSEFLSEDKSNDIKEYQFPESRLEDWSIDEYGPSFIYGFVMKLTPNQQEAFIDKLKELVTVENKSKYLGLLDIIEIASRQRISFGLEITMPDSTDVNS